MDVEIHLQSRTIDAFKYLIDSPDLRVKLSVGVSIESVQVVTVRVGYMLPPDNSIRIEHRDYDEYILLEQLVLRFALICEQF